MLKARPWGFDLRNILKKQIDEIWERESINLHDTKLFGVLRPEVIPDGVFLSHNLFFQKWLVKESQRPYSVDGIVDITVASDGPCESEAVERGDGLCVVVVALRTVELVENGCMTLVEHCHIVDVLAYGKLVCRLTDTAEDIFYCISRIFAWIIFSLIL